MFKMFESFWDFIVTIWNLVTNMLSSLVNAILIITQSVSVPLQLLSYVPAVIGSAITIVVSIGVIKLLIGWGNS